MIEHKTIIFLPFPTKKMSQKTIEYSEIASKRKSIKVGDSMGLNDPRRENYGFL